MVRHIVLGNGNFLINIDKWLQVRDIYFPYPGQENHLLGHANRTGVFVEGEISWINEDAWLRELAYKKNSLISECSAKNSSLQVDIAITDAVCSSANVLIRKFSVTNSANRRREFTMFFHQDLHLYGDGVGDTAGYDPIRNTIFHYKRERYVLISPLIYNNKDNLIGDLYEYSVGASDSESAFSDAGDGRLQKRPIDQGSVDSICSVRFSLDPHENIDVYYTLCMGKNFAEIFELYDFIKKKKPSTLLLQTQNYWSRITKNIQINTKDLAPPIQDLFRQSVLIIHSQIASNGAITAANDSDNMQFNKDTYSYVWTRDAALVAMALQSIGFADLAKRFYTFCKSIISKNGFFLHKYNPDKSLGSSWHPWVGIDGNPQLAIQEDETALVLIALWDYYEQTKDKTFIKKCFSSIIKPAAEFMMKYIHEDIDLPKESYDLWEERRGVLTFTCATVCGGLRCAAQFAALFKDKNAEKYLAMSKTIQDAIITHLYSAKKKRFVRMLSKDGESHNVDDTIDSSIYAVFAFGGIPADDPKVVSTMQQIEEQLELKTRIGGIARYKGDKYHRAAEDVPGNPWFISSLWLAKWHIAKAKKSEDLKRAEELLLWTAKNALSTGVLAEQIHPQTGEPLSVAPLTWSHAEFISTVTAYVKKNKELK